MISAEKIKPYDDARQKHEQVEEMFDNIAPAYDFMNRAMTLGIDRRWRSKAVKMVADTAPEAILDVATGTADLAIKLAEEIPQAKVAGVDLSEQMLAIGTRKVEDKKLQNRIVLQKADCLDLPFADNTFDAITVAYGVRNFEHLPQGYSQMLRVLRSGGTLCVIELSTPRSPLVKPLYKLYTRYIIPLVGRMVSRDVRAYSYLPESIAAVPQYEAMTRLMEECGFTNTKYKSLTFGACCIYTATKP